MSVPPLRRAVVALAALPLLALGAGQALAAPAPAPNPTAPAQAPAARAIATATQVSAIEDEVARALAGALTDAALRDRLRSATADAASGAADLGPLAAAAQGPAGRLAATTAQADRRIAAAKGLGDLGPLLRVQLADPSMRAALDAGAAPLVATAVADDHARTVRAYDTAGRAHALDAAAVPGQPVYLVDIDTARTLAAGMAVLQREFAARGLDTAGGAAAAKGPGAANGPATAQGPGAAQAAGGWWATKISGIEVADDEESWFKGAAEMFGLVTGFGQDGKVRVDSVAMPYLQYDGTVYYPNQILVNWSNYKYNLADVVLMEDDGDTNYLALAQAVAAVLLTIADQGAYIPLVNAVLAALPTSWWVDDPDYVESWYTLARTSSGRLNGARGNGWMTVEPYFVEQF